MSTRWDCYASNVFSPLLLPLIRPEWMEKTKCLVDEEEGNSITLFGFNFHHILSSSSQRASIKIVPSDDDRYSLSSARL